MVVLSGTERLGHRKSIQHASVWLYVIDCIRKQICAYLYLRIYNHYCMFVLLSGIYCHYLFYCTFVFHLSAVLFVFA